jgi:hypothetical protein
MQTFSFPYISLETLRAEFPALSNYKDGAMIKVLDEVNRDFKNDESIVEELVVASMAAVLAERGYTEKGQVISPELYRQRYVYNQDKGRGGPGVDLLNPVKYVKE